MAKTGPGKSFREGVTLVEIFRMFPDDDAAERWFAEARWPDGPWCPHCGSLNVQSGAKHKSQPYRCREKECRRRFSVKTGTAMHDSKLGLQVWAIAIYLSITNLKGVSSMKLHRDLGITQKTAWHLAHRVRETWLEETQHDFSGPVEVDETYMGGKEKNKHGRKKLRAGRGGVGKTVVVGAKDRATNRVSAKVIENTDKDTLHSFVGDHAAAGATPFTRTITKAMADFPSLTKPSIDIPQMTSKFAGVVLPIHRHGNSVPFVALRCGDFGGLIKFGTPFGKVFHHLDAPLPSFSPLR